MYIGAIVRVVRISSIIITLLVAFSLLLILLRQRRREVLKKKDLLGEADPRTFRESFRELVLHNPSVRSYIQDVYPFRVEPFEDSFLLERYNRSVVKEGHILVQFVPLILALFIMSLIITAYLFAYDDTVLVTPTTAAFCLGLGVLMEIGGVIYFRYMLREYRLELSLAKRFAKLVEEST